MATRDTKTKTKRKEKRTIVTGLAYVLSTFNNTIITITDLLGNVVAFSSAGAKGFRGSRKSTPFAAQMAAEDAGKKAQDLGMKEIVTVFIRGPGSGRESALRALQSVGFTIGAIKDTTPLPHNGCRPPKKRRL